MTLSVAYHQAHRRTGGDAALTIMRRH